MIVAVTDIEELRHVMGGAALSPEMLLLLSLMIFDGYWFSGPEHRCATLD